MAAAAEAQQNTWVLAHEAFPEAEQEASQRMMLFLGGIAVRAETEAIVSERPNNSTLLNAMQMAALGDERSEKVVRNNVAADPSERLFSKNGYQTEVHLQMANGRVQQEGRYLTDVSRNTLEYTVLNPEMLRRTTLDLKNIMVFEALFPTVILDSHDVIIWSTSSTKMSDQEKRKYNFFLDTETCSIQRLSATGGDVVLETAFVAGKKTPSSERHDITTIQTLAKRHGIAVTTSDGSDMLQYMMLVPKIEIPNGVVDIVRDYDTVAGGTFYGEAKPQQDYQAYVLECKARNQKLNEIVDTITAQLISEAHIFATPLEAIERLDYLSERLCVEYAVENHDVNAAIFGRQSAMHIEEARFFSKQGDETRAQASLRKAQQTANSGSCPLFKQRPESEVGGSTDGNTNSNTESSGKKWGKCPYCKAKVFVDPCAERLSCWDCKALVVKGVIRSTGDGGSRAKAAKKVELRSRQEQKIMKQEIIQRRYNEKFTLNSSVIARRDASMQNTVKV